MNGFIYLCDHVVGGYLPRYSQSRRPPFCRQLERPSETVHGLRDFLKKFSGIVPGKFMERPGTVLPAV